MDETKIHDLAIRVVTDMGGAFQMALAYIGDQLGLFKAIHGAGAITSQELADKTELDERYVREWLRSMVASQYLDFEAASGRYVMTDEQAFVLADEDSPMFVGGAFAFTTPSMYNTPRVMDSFRRGGGVPYREIGGDVPCAIERFFRPGYVNFLTGQWLATVPGLTNRLTDGIDAVDVGCGRGQSTVQMAKAFPNSRFVGIDYHRDSIASAMKLAADEGVENVTFIDAGADQIPTDRKYQLVTSFDCIHDMTDPVGALRSIRKVMAEDGVYLWSEPNASREAVENQNPIGRVFHAVSPMHCLTVSLAHGGAGLGTVIGEQGARELAEEAGFSEFEKLAIDNPFNQFFALKK